MKIKFGFNEQHSSVVNRPNLYGKSEDIYILDLFVSEVSHGEQEKRACHERPLLAGNCHLLCFAKLHVAFVNVSTFVF